MESLYFVNLIFILVLNVFFFFSGVCLNSVVIISFWRSVQLRKKLCYFMIMVLCCCDLLAVSTNNPLIAVVTILWLTEKLDLDAGWVHITLRILQMFFMISLLALLVMNFDRYLATSYPFFHRTSVTRRKLLTLLGILVITELTLAAMSTNDVIISFPVHMLILFILLTPPMLFIHYKLFLVVRENRRKNEISAEKKKTISSCLIAIACYLVISIPVIVYIDITVNSRETTGTFGNAYLAGIWVKTIVSMNCTFNCLIFYWKNKVLRKEGWKVIKSIKIWRGVQS